MSNPISNTVLSAAIAVLAACALMPAANAQQYGPTGIAQDGIGPIYSNPVFEGDARENDLYSYMHPSDPGPWFEYRQLVQEIASQSNAAIPPPVPIPVSRPYPYNPVVSEPYYGGEPGAASTPTSGVTNGQIEQSPFDSPPGLVQ